MRYREYGTDQQWRSCPLTRYPRQTASDTIIFFWEARIIWMESNDLDICLENWIWLVVLLFIVYRQELKFGTLELIFFIYYYWLLIL